MKTVYSDENNVVLDENSVERKPCINIESKSLELTNIVIQLSRYQHEVPSSCNTTVYLSGSKLPPIGAFGIRHPFMSHLYW